MSVVERSKPASSTSPVDTSLEQPPVECETKKPDKAPRRTRPRTLRYHPVPGAWERERHPNWPERRFQIPAGEPPYGTIYYVTRGTFVGMGMTAHIEKTPAGHIIKFPKTNPYDPDAERRNFDNMRIEAEVYRRLGAQNCPYVPRLIAWDPDDCSLTLEYLEHGNLAYYVRGMRPPDYQEDPPVIAAAVRRRWAVQATGALRALHAAGVIHSDFVPRNLLLDADLDLRVSDFAGSSIDGAPYRVCGGERFTAPGRTFDTQPHVADDLFSLGSVIFVIMTSKEPYSEKDDSEVSRLFGEKSFPDVTGIDCGAVIQGCWDGALKTSEQVLGLLKELWAEKEF